MAKKTLLTSNLWTMAQKASPSFQAVDMLVTLTPGYLVGIFVIAKVIINGCDNDCDCDNGRFVEMVLMMTKYPSVTLRAHTSNAFAPLTAILPTGLTCCPSQSHFATIFLAFLFVTIEEVTFITPYRPLSWNRYDRCSSVRGWFEVKWSFASSTLTFCH